MANSWSESIGQNKQNIQLFASWIIFHAFLSSADFFQNQIFGKILSGIPAQWLIPAAKA